MIKDQDKVNVQKEQKKDEKLSKSQSNATEETDKTTLILGVALLGSIAVPYLYYSFVINM